MKKIILLISIPIMLSACSSSKSSANNSEKFSLDTTKLVSGNAFYQCPMNPEVLSKEPGECPKCGMALEKITKN